MLTSWTLLVTCFFGLVVVQRSGSRVSKRREYHRLEVQDESSVRFIRSHGSPGKKQAVRSTFGFENAKEVMNTRAYAGFGSHHQAAPRYMYRLYEKYRTGELKESLGDKVDTVRNIKAELAIVNNASVFVFNTTSISKQENVLVGEIHVYKRRPHGSHARQTGKRAKILMKLYQLGPNFMREKGIFRFSDGKNGRWYNFGITETVRECSSMTSAGYPRCVLAVSFSDEIENGTHNNLEKDQTTMDHPGTNPLLLSNFFKLMSKPFLMVYTEEIKNKSIEKKMEMKTHNRPEIIENGRISNNKVYRRQWEFDNPKARQHGDISKKIQLEVYNISGKIKEYGEKMRNKSDEKEEAFDLLSSSFIKGKAGILNRNVTGTETNSLQQGNPINEEITNNPKSSSAGSATERRAKRSAMENEIPEVVDSQESPETGIFTDFNVPKKNPKVSRNRDLSSKRYKTMFAHKTESRKLEKVRSQKRVMSTNYRSRYKRARRRNLLPPGFPLLADFRQAQNAFEGMKNSTETPVTKHCERRKLLIDFAEIGWSDWIIWPKSFEAYYCSGDCSYPMNKNVGRTNHATIQSIIQQFGIHRDVPSPSCAPASMSSLTVLYFDQHRKNVVLKNYPNMSVTSCSCR